MLKLGLIGCGSIAHTHTDNIVNKLSGAKIVAVFDPVSEVADKLVADYQLDAKKAKSVEEVVEDPEVDAVLVCSRNDTHVAPILDAIKMGKPVFTEKPLATTAKDCKQIVDAEVAAGKRFVQVGFMRRFDPYYQQLKQVIDSGEIGAPILGYCRHFTAEPATSYFKTENMVNDAFIHEIDILHWLFNDDYQWVQIQYGRPNSLNPAKDLKDPQVATVKMKSGALVTVYLTQCATYGYDVKCQIIGEKGIAQLPDMPHPEMKLDGKLYNTISHDWTKRFAKAYEIELQDFINQVSAGNEPQGPTAWDGYIAAVTADDAIASQKTEKPVEIHLDEKPELYR
ncbi:Gfo/Idh/MocA family protein [Lactiplantibacillus plantarum]|uniref:Gfo/Idh/MocA family protein n=1 Tax=Lactiplantibacillus plantarum TaxID=1590 RepID=UPI002B1EA29A|nr:Gfo/Idh/MocA family oxidoreductase [Lactiplantibacillus plantarum]MEA5159075.1 Gfo/Idh/MocA family oxidoreductase [Lactiplantibacillus plantarum]